MRNFCSSSSALCSFSSSRHRTQPTAKTLSLYDWQNRESFMQWLQESDPGHLPSHSVLSSYERFIPLALWRLCLSTTSGPDPGKFPGFWGSIVFDHVPIPWKGSGTTTSSIIEITLTVAGHGELSKIKVVGKPCSTRLSIWQVEVIWFKAHASSYNWCPAHKIWN